MMARKKQPKVEEPMERAMHRIECPELSPYIDQCYLKSGFTSSGCHIMAECDGNCERMKKWDKEHGIANGTEFNLKSFD